MESTTRKSLHPLIAIAAVAVIVLSAVGIGAITGFIPTSRSDAVPGTEPLAETEPTGPEMHPRESRHLLRLQVAAPGRSLRRARVPR